MENRGQVGTALEGPVLAVRSFEARRADFSIALDRLELEAGGAAALFGPSGSGKTTLLRGLFGLRGSGEQLEVEGAVELGGRPWPRDDRRRRRQLLRAELCAIPQDARAALDPVRRIGDQLGELAGGSPDRAACARALRELGIEEAETVLDRFPHEISGGQAQRALLAVALLRRARLLVIDEPTSGLDRPRVDELILQLRFLRERTGSSVLVATHERHLVEGLDAAPFSVEDGRCEPGWPDEPPWPTRARDRRRGDFLVHCEGVIVARGRRRLLDDVDITLSEGEIVALVGASGAGKTTLARVVCGHLQPERGTVLYTHGPSSVQMLFQDAYASLTPHLTLGEQTEEIAAEGFDVATWAQRLGLDRACLERTPAALSGGERRRGALLRALAAQPRVLVLDEPTASLDRAVAVKVIEQLLDVFDRDPSRCVLLITHDVELAGAVADRTLRIHEGRM